MPAVDSRKRKLVSDIIRQLHQGLSVEEARSRIAREVGRITSSEITEIEQSLIDEGVSPDEIRKFCNVHALLFASALEASMAAPDDPSHPLALLAAENREIEKVIAALRDQAVRQDPVAFRAARDRLGRVERHYVLKENALFPYLEKHGFPGPSKVMWSKHNEVRGMLKNVEAAQAAGAEPALESLLAEVEGMIYKEENILFPAARERIAPSEWVAILKACYEIGFAFLEGAGLHATLVESERNEKRGAALGEGEVQMPSGRLSLDDLTAMLDTLPLDVTFVDADDRVKYFSQGKDRIFVRATSVIGRDVHNCHPPQSLHKVKRIIEDFRNGTRDHADFWITVQGKFVSIRYFAVRDPGGRYLGTMEVTQDLTEMRSLTGERRLLDEGA